MDGEGLVGVEVPAVRADEGRRRLEAFGSGFGHGFDEATEHEEVVGVVAVVVVGMDLSSGIGVGKMVHGVDGTSGVDGYVTKYSSFRHTRTTDLSGSVV